MSSTKPLTLRKAVDAHCKQCIYDGTTEGGSWRKQVANCTSPGCYLFPHRPVDGHTKEANKKERYNELSDEDKQRADIRARKASERMIAARQESH